MSNDDGKKLNEMRNKHIKVKDYYDERAFLKFTVSHFMELFNSFQSLSLVFLLYIDNHSLHWNKNAAFKIFTIEVVSSTGMNVFWETTYYL